MGFLSRLFGSRDDTKKQLEVTYVPMIQLHGFSAGDARKLFRELVDQAEEEARSDGSINLPPNFGDIRLGVEKEDDVIKALLDKKRGDGVRDEDIRWWGNMHELERRIMLKWDEVIKIAMVKSFVDQGVSMEAAVQRMNMFLPSYSGDPDAPSKATGDDRPLPVELKDRVNVYVMAKSKDGEQFKVELVSASSFNAFIRREVGRGNL